MYNRVGIVMETIRSLAARPLNSLTQLVLVISAMGLDIVTVASEVLLKCVKDIQPESVTWLWPGRIPLGKLTIFAGDPGLGKSAVALDVAARVSANRAFPDAAMPLAGKAVIMSAEDDPADTIRPRLGAAEADLSKVHVLEAVRVQNEREAVERSFNLTCDLDRLGAALGEHHDVRVIVIDPLSAYLGHTDQFRNAAMRGAVLGPLAKFASHHKVAIVGIDHLNKADKKAIYRVSGSIATVAASRVAWVFAKDKLDDSRRLMLPLKNNLAGDQEGLAYRVEEVQLQVGDDDPIKTIRIAWEQGLVTLNVNDALSDLAQEDDSALSGAMTWLEATLTNPMAAKDVEDAAKRDGISQSTLNRAKKQLRIKSIRYDERWMWAAPKNVKSDD